MSHFKDHFSGHAARYAAARPDYPDALFDFLTGCCRQTSLAWDCATGNGQAARSLARRFDCVVATDASEQQIASASGTGNIKYLIARAENSGLVAASVDLVTVAQALHWFDIDAFFVEAGRVLKPGGVLAFWCYQNCFVDSEVDPFIEAVYRKVDAFWPPERDFVENGYPHIATPFEELPSRDFEINVPWTADQLLAYVRTWSAVRRYVAANGSDPTDDHADDLRLAWGGAPRAVRWPIVLRVCRNPET